MNDVTVIVRPTAAPVINVVQATPPVITVNPMGVQGLPGEVGSSVDIIYNEVPAGTVNGSNATFITALPFVPGKISVFINGLLQKIITHYQTVGNDTILFNESPQTGDIIIINYIIFKK